jgi:hypothetical protein
MGLKVVLRGSQLALWKIGDSCLTVMRFSPTVLWHYWLLLTLGSVTLLAPTPMVGSAPLRTAS